MMFRYMPTTKSDYFQLVLAMSVFTLTQPRSDKKGYRVKTNLTYYRIVKHKLTSDRLTD